jgi:hypothetical protein
MVRPKLHFIAISSLGGILIVASSLLGALYSRMRWAAAPTSGFPVERRADPAQLNDWDNINDYFERQNRKALERPDPFERAPQFDIIPLK